MNHLRSNIDFLLKKHRTNAHELDEKNIGVKQSTIFRILNGITKDPRRATLEPIAKWANVPLNDLFDIDLSVASNESKRDGVPIGQVQDLFGREKVLVPFYADISGSCGGGRLVEAYEKTSEYKEIGKDILRDYGVSVANIKAFPAEGGSMSPAIMPGAVVYVDISRQRIIDGKIYAICHGGLFKFKQLYNLPMQGIRMVSTNSEEYPEEKLTRDEAISQEFEVVGYAFYVENRLP